MSKFTIRLITFVVVAILIFNITGSFLTPQTKTENAFIEKISLLYKKNTDHLRILSYNLLSDGIGYEGSSVALRKDGVVSLINALSPDILALQEVNLSWFSQLSSSLDLTYINTGESAVKSNMTCIFYNKKSLLLLDYGEEQFSVGSNPRLRKIVWSHFKERSTLKEFFLINTHFNLSDTNNAVSLIQCRELTEFANSLYKSKNIPIIIAGDFNAYDKSRDISESASVYEALTLNFENGQTDAFNKTQGKEKGINKTTDHIFYRGDIAVKNANILSNRELNRLSDHFPLYIDITIN